MEINLSEKRIVIDALKFKLADLERKHSNLDGSDEDKASELSNDIYRLEILTSCLIEDYDKRINELAKDTRDCFNNREMQPLSSVAV